MIASYRRFASLAAGLFMAVAAPAFAQAPAKAAAPAAPLTAEDIWKSPQLSGITLSRDGKYMAATAPVRGRMNLVGRARVPALAPRLRGFRRHQRELVGNNRSLYSLGQFNCPPACQFDGGGLFMSKDGMSRAACR
jgi:hypothetical protein